MKLSTGKVAFPIEFDNGDKDVIYFNPNDREIWQKIKAFEGSIEKRFNEIDIEKYKSKFDKALPDIDLEDPEKLLELSPEELNVLQERLDAINDIEAEYSKTVCDELDDVFNSKISDVAFRYCHPFDLITIQDEEGNDKKEIYVIHFLHLLMKECKKYGTENKSAMDKHLSKYAK